MRRKREGRIALFVAVLALLGMACLGGHAQAATNWTTAPLDLGTGQDHANLNSNTLTGGNHGSHGSPPCYASWAAGWVTNVWSGGTATGTIGGGFSGQLNVRSGGGTTSLATTGDATYFAGGNHTAGNLNVSGGSLSVHSGAGITGGGNVSVSQNMTVGGNVNMGNVYVGVNQTVTGTVTVAGTNRVMGNQSVLTNGTVTAATNEVHGNVLVDGSNAKVTATLNDVTGDVTVREQGEFNGTTNDIGGNVNLHDQGKFISGAGGGLIGGDLIMTDSSQISGDTRILGRASMNGTADVLDDLDVNESISISDMVTLKPNVDLISRNSWIELNGAGTPGRINGDGNNTMDANKWVSITDSRFQGTLDVVAGESVFINDKNKGVANNSSFEDDVTINAGQNVAINTGDDGNIVNFDEELEVNAGGAVGINTGAGDDVASFGDVTEITAAGGVMIINSNTGVDSVDFDAAATLTASDDIEINRGAGDKTAIFDDTATITSTGGDIVINKAGGNDSFTVAGQADITGQGHVTINEGAVFQTDANIKAVAGNLTITGDTFVTNANLESTTMNVIVSNSQLGTVGKIKAGQDVVLTDNMSTTGGANGLRAEAGRDVWVYGTDWTTSLYGSDTHLTATTGDIYVEDTRFQGNSHELTAQDDIWMYGVNLESVTGANASKITSNDGDILITNSQDFPTIGSVIGNGAQITTANGGVYIVGDDVNSATTTRLEDSVTVTANGDLWLQETTIGLNGDIKTTGGNVMIDNVKSGLGTIIQSTGVSGTGRNDWTLTGSDTHIAGKIELNSGGEDRLFVDDGYYNHIENIVGDMELYFDGGQITTIDNSNSNGTSLVVLRDHNNVPEDPATPPANKQGQSIEFIKGNAGQDDDMVVLGGVRFTEYENPTHNYSNYVGDPGHDPSKWAITNQITAITDFETLVLQDGTANDRTGLEIGTRGTPSLDVKFEVADTTIGGYADLFIHASTDPTYKHKADSITTVGPQSVVWIDRTVIDDVAGGGAAAININGSGSMLTGFQNLDAGVLKDHILGDVSMGADTILKPFSLDHNDYDFMISKFCPVQGVDRLPLFPAAQYREGVGMNISNDLNMSGNATLAIRIFTHDDATGLMTDVKDYDEDDLWLGTYTNLAMNSSDYVKVGNIADFLGSARLDVTFGNDNELAAKIGDRAINGGVQTYAGFNVYDGDGTTHDNSYYYSIVRSDNGITMSGTAIAPGDADNLYFGNAVNILKSDMLGSWDTMLDSTGNEVLLRYRLLAKHPVEGGIAIDMHEPNAAAVAKQIDRIRYPFDLNDQHVRYDGNMQAYYAQNSHLYPNYDYRYIADWEELLKEIQKTIESGNTLHTAMRKLHPEPYADLASLNLNLMDQLVKVREQHGVSALFQVEVDNYDAAVAEAEQYAERRKGSAYASLFDDYCTVEQFVCNPIRFWAAGFGADGKQQNVGTEYGYKTETWGGAVGMVKEFGDLYIGVTGGYAKQNVEWQELAASSKTDAYMADAVVGYRRGMGFIEAFGNYAYNEHSMRRYIDIGNYNGNAHGEYEDDVWGLGIRAGYQAMLGCNWLFIPTIGVNYIQTESGEFTEKGQPWKSAFLQFQDGGIKRRNVRVPLTARLNRSFAVGNFVLTPEVRGSMTAIFGNKAAKARARFVGDPGPSSQGHFTATGVKTGRWAAQLGGSLELSRRGRFTLSGNYDYTFSNNSHEHAYSIILGMNF